MPVPIGLRHGSWSHSSPTGAGSFTELTARGTPRFVSIVSWHSATGKAFLSHSNATYSNSPTAPLFPAPCSGTSKGRAAPIRPGVDAAHPLLISTEQPARVRPPTGSGAPCVKANALLSCHLSGAGAKFNSV